jgi:hypothetical protein
MAALISTPQKPSPSFVIVLRPEAGVDADQAVRGLRQILKDSLRRWGLRCVLAERVPAASEPTTGQDALASVLGPESAASTDRGIDT